MTKAQIDNFFQNSPLSEQNSQQNVKTKFSNDLEFQNRNFHPQMENQKTANDIFCSHDN